MRRQTRSRAKSVPRTSGTPVQIGVVRPLADDEGSGDSEMLPTNRKRREDDNNGADDDDDGKSNTKDADDEPEADAALAAPACADHEFVASPKTYKAPQVTVDRDFANPYGGAEPVASGSDEDDGDNDDDDGDGADSNCLDFHIEMDEWVKGDDSNSVPVPMPPRHVVSNTTASVDNDDTQPPQQSISQTLPPSNSNSAPMPERQERKKQQQRRQRRIGRSAAESSDDDASPLGPQLLHLYGIETYAACYGAAHAVISGAKTGTAALGETKYLLLPRRRPATADATVVKVKAEEEDDDEYTSEEEEMAETAASVVEKDEAAAAWEALLAKLDAASGSVSAVKGRMDTLYKAMRSGAGNKQEEGNDGDDAEMALADDLFEAVDAAMLVAEQAGLGEEISRDHRAFLRGVEKHQRGTLGYSYRRRPMGGPMESNTNAATAPSDTTARPVESSDIVKVGRQVVVPIPHHSCPEHINTAYQCVEPRQRKRLLEDHTVLPHPRKGTQSGVEDFLIGEQVTNDALATILRHVQTHRTLQGLPNTVSGVLLNLVYDGNPDTYHTRYNRNEGVNLVLRRVPELLARRAATSGPLLHTSMGISTMCHVALWQEEAVKAAAGAAAMLKTPDGPLGAAYGFRDIGGSASITIPNHLAYSSPSRTMVMQTLRLLVDKATIQALESTVLPLLAVQAPAEAATLPSSSTFVGSDLHRRCDDVRRDELLRLVEGFEIPHVPAVIYAPSSGGQHAAAPTTVAFPVTLHILLVVEALTALADQAQQLALLNPPEELEADNKNDAAAAAVPSCIRRMRAALGKDWGSCERIVAWALSDGACGTDTTGARLAAIPVLVDALALRVSTMLRDSGSRRSLALVMAFESYMADTQRSQGSVFHRCDAALRDGYRVQWLHAVVRKKMIQVHGGEAVAAGQVPMPDVFLMKMKVPANSGGSGGGLASAAVGSLMCEEALTISVAPRMPDALAVPVTLP